MLRTIFRIWPQRASSRVARQLLTLGAVLLAGPWTALPLLAQAPPLSPQLFSQYRADSRFDLNSQPETNDRIGAALAVGDFDGNGFPDLAIGCPFEDDGSSTSQLADSGWVTVIEGTSDGLDASPGVEDIPWDQDGDIEGGPEAGDRVGASVVTGNFNGDNYDDLVMGSPGEDIGSIQNTGSINVIYGSFEGLQTAGNRQLWQSLELNGHSVAGAAEPGDEFGSTLAVGNFNGDPYDDLAVGAPLEDIGGFDAAGHVIMLYGKPVIGLDPEGSVAINRGQGSLGGLGQFDRFGKALAAGDFNDDGFDDLVVGTPDRGRVDILFGQDGGIDATNHVALTLDTAGVDGDPQSGDDFGEAFAVGDFNDDGIDDLAVGIPSRDQAPDIFDQGALLVVYGALSGFPGAGSRYFEPGFDGLPAASDDDDRFGSSLAAGDLDGDGVDDLLVGVPGAQVMVDGNTRDGAGSARVLFGNSISTGGSGLDVEGSVTFDYNQFGTAATSDGFADQVAMADFNQDGQAELVFAVPR